MKQKNQFQKISEQLEHKICRFIRDNDIIEEVLKDMEVDEKKENKQSFSEPFNPFECGDDVIATCHDGLAYFGSIYKKLDGEVILLGPVFLENWENGGNASLLDLAEHGLKHPQDCEFPKPGFIILIKYKSLILCTPKAAKSIESAISL